MAMPIYLSNIDLRETKLSKTYEAHRLKLLSRTVIKNLLVCTRESPVISTHQIIPLHLFGSSYHLM